MALAYYGVRLSDNRVETPEGYLIFKNAVIGRTGFQKYKGSELNQEELSSQGVTLAPNDEIELYRSEDEVFNPKTIASFETKSITDGHPDQLLTLDTVKEHEQGQITNVRKGPEPLESGDWPLLADLVIKSRILINKINAGLRELSCGYNYHVLKQGDLLLQVDIVGNHVAIVNVGRAGPEASLKDSIASSLQNGVFNMSAFLDRLLNKPTKTKIAEWAKTATPEEISVAMDALVSEVEKKAEGKDASMHKEGCSNDDCKGCKDAAPGKDAKSMDRKRFYDALDRMLDGKEEEMNAADADMEELKAMFNGGGKGKDETVAGEQSGKEMPENGGIDESVEALTIEPEDRTKSSGTGTDEASYKAGAFAVLKSLKPFIAASKNKAAIGAFDTAVKIVAGSSTSKGGYGAVVKAAATVGADAVKQKTQQEIANAAIDEATKANAARFNQRN